MAPLDVNPAELSAAGERLGGDGNALVAALSALTGGLSGVNPGHDPLGQEFGRGYRHSGAGLLKAGGAAISAAQRMAYGIKMSAYNYALANAMSVPGGGEPSLPVPPCPAPVPPPAMPDASGHAVAAPALWAFVAAFVGYGWPDGDPASMRTGAQAWRTYGEAVQQAAGELAGTQGAITGLPESEKMSAAINQLGLGMVDIAGQCHQIAEALNSFAGTVESAQNAIRDLLHRLNPMGLAGLVFSVFKDGDPLGAIKAVAHDIEVLLGHVRDEADAAGRQFERGLGVIDSAADGLQRWINRDFPVVAPVVNGFIDIEVGVTHSAAAAVKGAVELSPSRFLYDPKGAGKAWTGAVLAAGMLAPPAAALLSATHPADAVKLGKGLIAYDDWNSDHPLRGLGRNIGDVAQFFVPGAGETKPAVTAAETSARASEAGAGLESALGATAHDSTGLLGRVGEVGGEIGSQTGKAAADLDRIPATTLEPPRPPSGPEPPQRGAMPAENPEGPAPPSRPGMPAAEVKPTAVEAPIERSAVHEPPPEAHLPAPPHEAPLSERPGAAHPPGDPPSRPHSEQPAPAEHPADRAPTPPAAAHPVDAAPLPRHPSEPTPVAPAAGGHTPPVSSDLAARPAATLSDEIGRAAAQAAEPAKALPAEAATPRALPSEIRGAPGDGAHGPADTPAAVADRPAPAGDRPPPGDTPGEGDHPPLDNANDPVSQAGRDHGIAEDAREPGSSNEPADRCANGEPVDMATGEYFLPMTDVELPGVLPLLLTRQHRSQFRRGVWFGPSWTSTFDARVVVSEDAVTTVDADGTMLLFDHPGLDAPAQPRHGRNWLLFGTSAGGYRLFSQDTERSYHFEPKSVLNGTDLAVGVLSISAITDQHHNRILFHYSDNGIPVAVTHSGGYRVDVHSDGARITGFDLGGQRLALRRFGYDGGDLVSVTDACGATTSFAYDGNHRMVGWTDSVGARYENVYDADGRITSQQGTEGVWAGTFDFVSTSDGLVSTFTDAFGAQTAYEFDADLRPRRVMDPEGRLTATEFNRFRDPAVVSTPGGAVTRYEYTEHGDIAAVTDALGAVTRFGYASPRHPNLVVREGRSPVTMAHDSAGNVVAVTSDGATRRFEYNDAGALIAVVDEEGRRTSIAVNAAGLPTRYTDAEGFASVIDYDAFGRAIAVTDPNGQRTVVRRDAEGRVLQHISADGSVQSWSYDGEGNCVAHEDELGARTGFEYGYYDKLTAQIAPDGSRTEYRYDKARCLVEVINPDGLVWRYTYHRDGRLASETDFNGATTTYRYDAAGRVAEKTNAEGQSIRYSYDPLGRVVSEITGGEVTHFRYGMDGELSAATNPHGTGTYRYDRGSRVLTSRWNEQTVTASLTVSGQLDTVLSPTGVRTVYRYDSRGALTGMLAAGRVIDLGADGVGRIVRAEVGRARVQREFDPLGRLVAQAWGASTEGQLFLGPTPAPTVRTLTDASYAYRPDGALTTRTVDQVPTRYQLDSLGRVSAAAVADVLTEQFSYDATHNITAAAESGFGPRRWHYRGTLLLDDGRSHYTYDRAGRLVRTVTRRRGRKPEVWHYHWDAYDRLRRVTTPDGQSWTYGYDPANRRTHKTNTTTGHTVTFCWLGDQLIEQTATDEKTLTWSYAQGALTPLAQVQTTGAEGVDVPLRIGAGTSASPACSAPLAPRRDSAQPEIDRAFYALVTDHLGTPTHLIDPATATVAAHATTSLWGHTTWTGEVSTPLRFPGQYLDPETGWHYNRHRYYQPHTGRYTTPDPLGLTPAPNPHTYPRNPTIAIDPWGLMPCRPFELKSLGNSRYESPAGLEYRPGSEHGHRLTHVLQHAFPDTSKSLHSVFLDGLNALRTIDEAWSRRGAHAPNDPGRFDVLMGSQVGAAGETGVRIVVKPGTTRIVTAYPIEIS